MWNWWTKLGTGGKFGVVVAAFFIAQAIVAGPDTTPPEPTAFDPDQVWYEEEQPVAFNRFSRVLVNFVTDGDALVAAEECVDYYLKSYDSVACYAFDSDEAVNAAYGWESFEAAYEAEFDTSEGMTNLCWSAMADKVNPEAPRTSRLGHPSRYDECP